MRFIAVFVLAILALAAICNGGKDDKKKIARKNKNLAPSGTNFLDGSRQAMHKVLASNATHAQKGQQLAQNLQRMQTDYNKKYEKLPQFSGTPSTPLGMPPNYYAPQQTSNPTPHLPQSQSTGRTGATNQPSQFQVQQPSASSHYGGAIPFPDTLFPHSINQSAQLNPSTNFGQSQNDTQFWGNSQNNEGTLESVIKSSSSEAFSKHPFNQSAPLNPSTNFGQSQTETHSLDWSGENSQNDDLYSLVNTRKRSSSKSTAEKGKSVFKPRK
uniref:Uncharacterized protein n=1 Tax=Globodera rostochiensis TaxID=31243 RepID=A0A914GSF2_GLORO